MAPFASKSLSPPPPPPPPPQQQQPQISSRSLEPSGPLDPSAKFHRRAPFRLVGCQFKSNYIIEFFSPSARPASFARVAAGQLLHSNLVRGESGCAQ